MDALDRYGDLLAEVAFRDGVANAVDVLDLVLEELKPQGSAVKLLCLKEDGRGGESGQRWGSRLELLEITVKDMAGFVAFMCVTCHTWNVLVAVATI